jgi:hypothetical protein
MKVKKVVEGSLKGLRIVLSGIVLFQLSLGGPVANAQERSSETATPIKHVIVIIGENRSFDHVFATYEPKPRHWTTYSTFSTSTFSASRARAERLTHCFES